MDNELAGAPAAAPEVTATPAPEQTIPPEGQTAEVSKTFTQEELDAIVSKRLAREQRKWEREQKSRPELAAPPPTLRPDDFDNAQNYAEAIAEQKAQEILAQRQVDAERQATVEAYHDREEDARTKYDDFEQVAYNPKLPITEVMAQTIQASEIGPDVIYHLGSNPKEAERIAKLSPFLQAREIGKIEARMATNPPAKRTTAAPAPIAPVTARTTGSPAYDTTDPRSVKNMSTSEWIEAERLRQRKVWEAKHNLR